MPTMGESRRCRPSVSRKADGRESASHSRERLIGPRCPLNLSTIRIISMMVQRKSRDTK